MRRVLPVVGGPALVFAVAWWSSTADQSDLALANVALLLAVLTVAVALTSPLGGITTSVVAALSLNWFHTQPTGSFRISSSSDVASVALLGALGLGVSAITARRVRFATKAGRHDAARTAQLDIEDLTVAAQPSHDLWHAAVSASSPELALADARLTFDASPDLPVIGRHTVGGDGTLVLPATGAVVPLRSLKGHLVLVPREGVGPLEVDRHAVAALADTVDLLVDGRRTV